MDAKNYYKMWVLNRKVQGLCVRCGKHKNGSISRNCNECKELVNESLKIRRLNSQICIHCYRNPKSRNSKRLCVVCLEKDRNCQSLKRQTQYGKWLSNCRTCSRQIAKGSQKGQPRISSRLLHWSHQDFCKAFPSFKESGKQLDHIIPLACAESSFGQLDEEFGKLVVRLENIQLLTPSENTKKAKNLDRQIIARAKDLRQQGKSGADLFHQLWAEFAWPQRQEG
jgi:hypothetical protein